MSWLWGRNELDKTAAVDAQPPIASGSAIHVAALAYDYGGKSATKGIAWAWATHANERLALGHALQQVPSDARIVGRLVIEIPLASGIEAPQGGETTEIGSTEGESPVPEGETP